MQSKTRCGQCHVLHDIRCNSPAILWHDLQVISFSSRSGPSKSGAEKRPSAGDLVVTSWRCLPHVMPLACSICFLIALCCFPTGNSMWHSSMCLSNTVEARLEITSRHKLRLSLKYHRITIDATNHQRCFQTDRASSITANVPPSLDVIAACQTLTLHPLGLPG